MPYCLSTSQIALGSIGMKPVFILLGQSASTAASTAASTVMAVDSQMAV